MKYLLLVIDDGNNLANAGEIDAIDAFNDSLVSAGYFVTAAGIHSSKNAQVIDNRLGADLLSHSSNQPGPDHYTGFWIIEVADDETALALAKDASKACNRRVELRPYLR